MKNEIYEFFSSNLNELDFLLVEARKGLSQSKFSVQKAFVLVNILYEFIKEEKVDVLFKELQERIHDESSLAILRGFVQEEIMNIVDFMSYLKFTRKEETLRIVDFEWKFVGLADPSHFDKNELNPKIFLKLVFNNGKEEIIESDYSNFKKLQEELEEAVTSFDYSYTKRIEKFSK